MYNCLIAPVSVSTVRGCATDIGGAGYFNINLYLQERPVCKKKTTKLLHNIIKN